MAVVQHSGERCDIPSWIGGNLRELLIGATDTVILTSYLHTRGSNSSVPKAKHPNAFKNQRKQSKTNIGGEAYYKPQHDPVLHRTKNTLITIRNKSTSRSKPFALFSQGNTKVLAMSQEGEKIGHEI
jgi:hypothetical protein